MWQALPLLEEHTSHLEPPPPAELSLDWCLLPLHAV